MHVTVFTSNEQEKGCSTNSVIVNNKRYVYQVLWHVVFNYFKAKIQIQAKAV